MEERKAVKSRRPSSFTRHEAGSKARIKSNWRKPNGHQNKMRLNKKGHKSPISQGYRFPKSLRNVDTQTGKKIVYVQNITDLAGVYAKTQGIIIASTLGTKKKIEVLKVAEEKKITVLSGLESEKVQEDIQAYQKSNKDAKTAKLKAAKSKEDSKKKKTAKPKAEEKKTEAEEKKEQDKTLIHKQ